MPILTGIRWYLIVVLIYISLVEMLRRRQWHATPVLLPGKSHGRRSLVGCSPWGHKESDMTEQLHFHFSLSHFGQGNGNPLQCPCLENPRDGGTLWAAVYGVSQSRTRLKWLSSSSRPKINLLYPNGYPINPAPFILKTIFSHYREVITSSEIMNVYFWTLSSPALSACSCTET